MKLTRAVLKASYHLKGLDEIFDGSSDEILQSYFKALSFFKDLS